MFSSIFGVALRISDKQLGLSIFDPKKVLYKLNKFISTRNTFYLSLLFAVD